MSDNVKTWPECIYLYGDPDLAYESQTEKLAWSEDNFNENIKYIRVDIAEKREEKLIMAAYHSCTSLAEVRDSTDGAKLLYKRAKLEELKYEA